MVRLLTFEGGSRWIARLRMPPFNPEEEGCVLLRRELNVMQLLKERTSIPVPAVYGPISGADNQIGAPLMLIECFAGNIASDIKNSNVPTQYPILCKYCKTSGKS